MLLLCQFKAEGAYNMRLFVADYQGHLPDTSLLPTQLFGTLDAPHRTPPAGQTPADVIDRPPPTYYHKKKQVLEGRDIPDHTHK